MRRLLVLAVSLLSGLLLATPAMAATPAPLGGGSTLYDPAGPVSDACTAGFAATSGSGGWFLIASGPGCGRRGATLFSGAGVPVGTVVDTAPDGLAVVQVTNHTNWTLVSWVGPGDPFDGRTDPKVGAPVCLYGVAGPVRCGEITAVNVTVIYPGGAVNGLASTNIVADSNGPAVTFVSQTKAVGVLVRSPGQYQSYFQPINPVLARYGLSLLI